MAPIPIYWILLGKRPYKSHLNKDLFCPTMPKNKLGEIYHLLLSDSKKIQADWHLIKIDSHKVEYLLNNLFAAVQSVILQTKQYHEVKKCNYRWSF